jgi:hypothetical protein
MNINHFYHLYVNASWEGIYRSHIESIISSDLISNIKHIRLGIVGKREEKEKAISITNEYGIKYTVDNYTEDGWEQETLKSLYASSLCEDGVSFYAHSKGASAPVVEGIQILWKNILTHATVDHWKECLSILRNYDTVGPLYVVQKPYTKPFYAGNFWWAKNEYIRKLSFPPNTNRWEAESWLYTNGMSGYDIKNGNNEPFVIYDGWLNTSCKLCDNNI